MTDDDTARPRMLTGLSHRYGDGLTVDQMRALEAAERDRKAARNAPPPEPPSPLVTVGGKPPPAYRPAPKRDPRPQPRRISMNEAAFHKLRTAIESLSAEERALLRELRAVHPDAAGQALARIRQAKGRKTEEPTTPSDAYARRPWPSVEHRDPTRY